MGFSRQECRSGLPYPSPGDLPNPGIEPESLNLLHWQVGCLPLEAPGKPYRTQRHIIMYFPWGGTRTLLYITTALLFDCFSSVPAFLCPLKITDYWPCSRASAVARLRSQNGFSYVKKAIPDSFSRDSLTYLLTQFQSFSGTLLRTLAWEMASQ